MPKVIIPTVFQGPTRGESDFDVGGESITACMDLIEAQHPGVKDFVIDPDTGAAHKFVKLTLNGELIDRDAETLARPLASTDEIEIIAAIAGG
jgi:molybdopterin converting factor small subunit